MSKTFLTSDTHFCHQLVAHTRGHTTTTDHDIHIINTWNSIVSPRDTVWHLGDVGIGPLKKWRNRAEQLNGKIHLVTGNHDEAAPGVSRKAQKVQQEWLEIFTSIQPFARLRRGKQHILMSHYPYTGEGARNITQRYTEYRLRNEGFPLIHGHTHDAQQRLSYSQGTPMLHVGWDAWGRPIEMSEALTLLLKRVRTTPT